MATCTKNHDNEACFRRHGPASICKWKKKEKKKRKKKCSYRRVDRSSWKSITSITSAGVRLASLASIMPPPSRSHLGFCITRRGYVWIMSTNRVISFHRGLTDSRGIFACKKRWNKFVSERSFSYFIVNETSRQCYSRIEKFSANVEPICKLVDVLFRIHFMFREFFKDEII